MQAVHQVCVHLGAGPAELRGSIIELPLLSTGFSAHQAYAHHPVVWTGCAAHKSMHE